MSIDEGDVPFLQKRENEFGEIIHLKRTDTLEMGSNISR